MKLVTLLDAPHLRGAQQKLIQDVFPRGAPTTRRVPLEQEFSLLLDPANAARSLLITDDAGKEVLASASYRVFEFPLAGVPLRCAGIGLVVTKPEEQRKGHGFRIQQEIEARAQQEKCLFTVLWSDLVQFYTKLGYVLAGTELQWQLDNKDLDLLRARLRSEATSAVAAYKVSSESDFNKVRPLYEAQKLGPRRPQSELYSKLMQLPNTFALTARNHQGQIAAYAFVGKGRDLRDTVHELVGEAAAIPALLQATVTHLESGLRLGLPAKSKLASEVEHWLGKPVKNALAFFKALRGPDLAEWIARSGILPSGIHLLHSAAGFQLRNNQVSFFESDDWGHLFQLFFGPWNIEELEQLPAGFQSRMMGMKGPLPFYFWGFDSV